LLGPHGLRQLAARIAARGGVIGAAKAAPVLLILLLVGCDHSDFAEPSGSAADQAGDRVRARVTKHTDGDTLWLSGIGKVRLIGVDTPEVYGGVECYGREASAFVKRLLPLGARVRYLLDVEERDRYGRALAYVYTGRWALSEPDAGPARLRPAAHDPAERSLRRPVRRGGSARPRAPVGAVGARGLRVGSRPLCCAT
jgi:hypothetical protein